MPFPVCREPRAIYKVGFRRRRPGALKRGKCPGEAQSPLSSVYATVPRGSVARQPLRRRMLSQFLCRAVARWNEPLPIAAGDARRGRSWGCVGAVPASFGSIGEVGSGMARKSGDTVQRDRRGGAAECISRQYACGVSSACLRKYGTGTCTVPAKVVVNCPWGACRAERRGCIVEKKS